MDMHVGMNIIQVEAMYKVKKVAMVAMHPIVGLDKAGEISQTIVGILIKGCLVSLVQNVSLLRGVSTVIHQHMGYMLVRNCKEKPVLVVLGV